MINLSEIPAEVLVARGEYSTVRAAHEDEKKRLQIMCGTLTSAATQILRQLQPDSDAVPESVEALLASARKTLDGIEQCAKNIESLAQQRAELKAKAWSK